MDDDASPYSNLLSRDSTTTNPIPLTSTARKYGERGSQYTDIPSGKSGLTPTDPALGTIPDSYDDYKLLDDLTRYQMKHFMQFSSQDLTDILAAEKPDAVFSSLWNITGNLDSSQQKDHNIGIMPMLQQDKWVQLGDEKAYYQPADMYFEAKVDQIWNVLKPSLQLASRILNNLHTSSFYDTLFYGERRLINPTRTPKDYVYPSRSPGPFESMWPRNPQDRTVQSLSKQWSDFAPHIIFSIDPKGSADSYDGLTLWSPPGWQGANVRISPHLIIPLLSSQLTISERLRATFSLARTIMHEIAHAIEMFKLSGNSAQEPYYQDESVAELGFSAENAIWGGLPVHFGPKKDRDQSNQNENGPPKFWLGFEMFPTRLMYRHYNTGQTELDLDSLGAETSSHHNDYHPMRTDFCEDIQNSNFWAVLVQKFGNNVLKDSDPLSLQSLLALRDKEPPLKIVETATWDENVEMVGMSRLAISKVDRFVQKVSGKLDEGTNLLPNDAYAAYRARRMRTSRKVVETITQRRRDAFRSWRKWGDPLDPPRRFELLPESYALNQSEVIEHVPASMGITPLALRSRGRTFVQNAVRDYLDSNNIPRDTFDLDPAQDVMLEYQESKAGVVATDLNDIYQDILRNERALGTDVVRDIQKPLEISQQGGDLRGMYNLVCAVRKWLEQRNHDPTHLDEEMERRHTDARDPIKTFYIRPNLQEVMNLALEDAAARLSDVYETASEFEKCELLRNYLEQHTKYPREALDDQIGHLPKAPGNLKVLQNLFLADVLKDIERDNSAGKRFILMPFYRRTLLRKLRGWLLKNQYSTKLDLGLGS